VGLNLGYQWNDQLFQAKVINPTDEISACTAAPTKCST
jgi:hypothetical protein